MGKAANCCEKVVGIPGGGTPTSTQDLPSLDIPKSATNSPARFAATWESGFAGNQAALREILLSGSFLIRHHRRVVFTSSWVYLSHSRYAAGTADVLPLIPDPQRTPPSAVRGQWSVVAFASSVTPSGVEEDAFARVTNEMYHLP